MIITSKIQGTGVLLSLGRRSAPWIVALAAGSIFLACSGTIETPTDEYPTRSNANAAANDDDDDTAAADDDSEAPAAPRPRPAAPAADDDDDTETPAASDDDEAPVTDEDEPPAEDEEPAGGASLAFETDVWPIFNTTCGPCHAGGGLGGNNIGDPDVDTAFEDATRVADRVVARITAGGMPPSCSGGAPGDPGCITAADFEIVEAWIEAGTPE
jgi:hypothetical protein